MEKTAVRFIKKPRLKVPNLVGGLPGMGYVGKLAAEHLVAELHAEKFAELQSPHFPHHVVIESNGILRPLKNEFYFARADGKEVIILVGDVQPVYPEGHYEVTECILELAEEFSVRRIFTLGGYATGEYPKTKTKPKVVGVGDPKLLEELEAYSVTVESGEGSIVGAAGLLLGMGELRGIRGVCLLGQTHGMVVDHRAAQAVLEVLVGVLGLKIDMSALEQRARETERMIERIRREMELRAHMERRREEEEAWYIG